MPVVDRKIAIDTSSVRSLWSAVGELRRAHYDAALDLQGLLKSAVLARLSGISLGSVPDHAAAVTRIASLPQPLRLQPLQAARSWLLATADLD